MPNTIDYSASVSTIINQALQGTDLKDIKVGPVQQGEDGNLSVTLTNANGTSQTVQIEAPDLDAGTGNTLSEESIAQLKQKLDGIFKELSDAFKTGAQLTAAEANAAGGSRKMLFDIYSLMQLMLEIGKQEREAARHTRDAELQRSVADVRNRADSIRTGAQAALVMSVVFSVASIAAQAVSTGMSFKAQGTAAKMENAAGMKTAQENLSLLSAKNAEEATGNLVKIDRSMSREQVDFAKSYFGASGANGAAQTGSIAAKTELNAAQTELKTATATAALAKEALGGNTADVEARLATATKNVETTRASLSDLERKVATCDAKFKSACEFYKDGAIGPQAERLAKQNYDTAFRDLQTAKNELETARTQLTGFEQEQTKLQAYKTAADNQAAAQTKVDTLLKNYATELDGDMNSLESALATKKMQLADCEKKGGTLKIDGQTVTTKQLQAQITDLEAARYWGKAYVVSEKLSYGLQESLNNDYANAEKTFGQKTQMLQLDAEYRSANMAAKGWETAGTLSKQLGDMLNAVVQQYNAMGQATSTDYEATQKTDESAREESNDLADSARQLIKTVLDLLQSVQSAETQSIQRIMA